MKDETKAKIKALEFLIASIKQVQKAKDPREKLAAVELEVEFTERIEKLRLLDREPEIRFHPEPEPAAAGVGGGQ